MKVEAISADRKGKTKRTRRRDGDLKGRRGLYTRPLPFCQVNAI